MKIFNRIANLLFFCLLSINLWAWNNPTISTPTSGSSTWTGVTLDWNAVSSSQYYQLQVDTSALFNSPVFYSVSKSYINSSSANTDTEHYLENLLFGKTYYWRVRAFVTNDTSAWTASSFVTRDYVTQASPTDGSTAWTGLTLDWYAHTGVDYYDLVADTSANFNSPALKSVTNAYTNSNSSNTDTETYLENLYFGKTYYWKVRARNSVDTTAWSSVWTFVTRDYVTQASPTDGSTSWTGLTLDWYAHTGVDYYDVVADTSANFNSPALKSVTNVYSNSNSSNSDTETYLENLYFGKTYYWKVRARNTVDTTAWSSVWTFVTRDYVTQASPTDGSTTWTGLTLDWYSHTGVDYYDVVADTSANFNSPALKSVTNVYSNSNSSNSDTETYLENLYFGKTYYWKVRARNTVDTTAWSSVWTFVTRDYVTQASPTDGSTTWTGLTLDWYSHAGVDYYDLVADTSANFNSPALKSVTNVYSNSNSSNSDTETYFENLYFGKTYYWKVRARNTVDTTAWSSVWTFVTRDYVTQVSPSDGSNTWTGLTLDWSAHAGVDYYDFVADTSANFNSPALKSVTNTYTNSNSSNTDTETYLENLYFGKTYYWKVRARNTVDTTAWSSVWTFTTRDYVTQVSPSDGNNTWTGLTLDWSAHAGVDYYDFVADTSANFNSPALKSVTNIYVNSNGTNTDTETYLEDLYFGKMYYWKVRARNTVDTSSWSSVWTFTTRDYVTLTSPTNGQLNVSVGGTTLNWNAHTGVNVYQMMMDTTLNFNSPLLVTQNTNYVNSSSTNTDTQYSTGAIRSNQIYYWKVRAINTPDTSAWTMFLFNTGSCSPATQPLAISGNINTCNGSSNTYSIALVSGATSYTWILPAGWSGTSSSNSINTVAGSNGGEISVIANNTCGSSIPQTLNVSVNGSLPANAGTISGDISVCQGESNVTYQVPLIQGASSYIWTLPSGASGTSTTNSISVSFGNNAVTGNIIVKGDNACGNGISSSLEITVNSLPATAGTITGDISVCKGENNVNYQVPLIQGANSYIWTLPSGASGTSTTNSISVSFGSNAVTGNIIVKGDNACGNGISSSLEITVNTIPATAGTITGDVSVCQGENNVTYQVPLILGATSYIWTLPSGASGTSTTNSISVNFANNASNGNISVKGDNACGNGISSSLEITVNSLPATAGTIIGDVSVCQGENNVTYQVPLIQGATSYIWTLPSGASGSSTTNSISVSFGNNAVTGNIIVKGDNACGNGIQSSLNIVVNAKPITPIISVNGNVLHSDAANGNQWYDQSGLINSAVNQNYTVLHTGDYYSIVTLNACSSDPSNSIHVVVSGIDDVQNSSFNMVYPNPFSNFITIENDKNHTEYELINALGQMVTKGSFSSKTVIHTDNLPAGMYYLKMINGNSSELKKVIKD